ncbi:DUF6635 family protein [Methylocaldum gracile]|jgi:hypothetical protein|uniref:DUF6635 family protein n=1 Tax=Methylocaldum sp. 0917 TaxID=2485163 RepID=UPI00105F8DEC
METDTLRTIERAVTQGIETYLVARKAKVPEFVEQYFSFPGALALHKKTFGKDFYKHPLNMLWGLPSFIIHGTAALFRKTGAHRVSRILDKMPTGIPTALQAELQWLIYTELLELPYVQGERTSRRDALMETILCNPEISALCEQFLGQIRSKADHPEFRRKLESNLAEYGKTRIAVTELAGSLVSLATSYAAFNKALPGAFSTGMAAASAIAQHTAVANFWLGPTIGAWYYGLFPASASTGLIIAATGTTMAAVSAIAALSWVVVDPLLAKTGIHERRLNQFIDAIGDELRGKEHRNYRVRDHYVARVFDLLDILRVAAKTLS